MLKLAFDGTDFHGWQRQGEYRTVQGVMEDVLRHVVRHPVKLTGCGRTDAGVHAVGHIENFHTSFAHEADKLQRALTSRLPYDLAVVSAQDVPDDFHANRSAISKLYRYRVFNSPARPVSQLSQRYVNHYPRRLDMARMQRAAEYFVGSHDFTSMANVRGKRITMVRTVLRCDVTRDGDEIHIDVEGTGFLYNQVRIMAGTLIETGHGRWEPEEMLDLLNLRDRTKTGFTAPAHGLCLQWVKYPEEMLIPEQVDRVSS